MTTISRRPFSASANLGVIELTAATENLIHTNTSGSQWHFVQLVLYNSNIASPALPTITVTDADDNTEVITVGIVSYITATGDKGIALPIALSPGAKIEVNPIGNGDVMAMGWVE